MTKEFSPQDAMEFFQKMWNPLGMAFPGMPPAGGAAGTAAGMPPFMPFPPNAMNAMNPFATFDPVEVEKKILEFKAVETWLNLQIGMLQMTIKTMEMQKASLDALHAQAKATAQPTGGTGGKGGRK